MKNGVTEFVKMGHLKQKSVFKHVQNVQIQIHTLHALSLIQAFALH